MNKNFNAKGKRRIAEKNSDLPYSFSYKIKHAFMYEKCPLCGCTMSTKWKWLLPTIQHNLPIALGGKHEIDNISVICFGCNVKIQHRYITGKLNNDLVKEKWSKLCFDERNGKPLKKKKENI